MDKSKVSKAKEGRRRWTRVKSAKQKKGDGDGQEARSWRWRQKGQAKPRFDSSKRPIKLTNLRRV